MALPSLAVITPSLNQGTFIERTLRSVLEQEIEGLDYLVVDGGSTDETVDILRRHEGRLRFLSEPDEGQTDAINKGLARTEGEIVGWLNSDDLYYSGALKAVQRLFATHPEVDVVYGKAQHIDEGDRRLESYHTEPWDADRLFDRCFLCQPATFVRRSAMERCGPLDTSLQFCMDYEYWLRLSASGSRFFYLQRTLAGSRLHQSAKTLAHRLGVHREMNHMLRRTIGRVPDRWLANYAHAALQEGGLSRQVWPRTFVLAVSALTRLAALRWNRSLSPELRQTTSDWARGALRRGAANPPSRAPRARNGRPLRIGFDVSQTGTEKAGCGFVADSLVAALAAAQDPPHLILYRTFGDRYWDPAGPEATRRIDKPHVSIGLTHRSLREARAFWGETQEDLDEALGDADVIHSHNFFCPSRLSKTRLVYTAHDLSFLSHPELTSEANRQTCVEGMVRASFLADLVAVPSESSRRHFLEAFPHYPPERTTVLPWASRFSDREPLERPSRLENLVRDRFVLHVGTCDPRKNLPRLLQAFASAVEAEDDPLSLVLAGAPGLASEAVEREIEDLGITPLVQRLGYVGDDELQWLYQSCSGFLYPSLVEGFGLPVLEALSQGAAVLTSDASSLPEVAGDAAILVDPTDVAAMRAGLVELCRDTETRRRLRAEGPKRAARFSWERTAEEARKCYERAAAMEKLHRRPHDSGLASRLLGRE